MNIAVVRALDILKIVGNNSEPMSLTDISKALDIPKTTAFNIINTLVEEKCLIVKDKRSKLYELGIGIYEIGSLYINNVEYLDLIRDSIRRIKDKLSTSSFACIVDNDELIYIDKVETNDTLKSSIKLGHRMPMYSASLGKAILAYYDDKALEDYINRVELKAKTKKTITSKDDLKRELEAARVNGYAVSDEENDIGLYCISAPIFDKDGKAFAAISASFVKININEEIIEKAKNIVLEESNNVSRFLGYKKDLLHEGFRITEN